MLAVVSHGETSPRAAASSAAAAPAGPAPGPPVEEPGTRPAPTPPRPLSLRRLLVACAAVAALLHAAAVLWLWFSWRANPGWRSSVLIYLDLPVSLVYLHLRNELLLLWSLLLGGIQWAASGALVAWVVGWLTVRGRRRGRSRRR